MLDQQVKERKVTPVFHNFDKNEEELQEISEECVNDIFVLLQSQAKDYQNAGLTQISNWL